MTKGRPGAGGASDDVGKREGGAGAASDDIGKRDEGAGVPHEDAGVSSGDARGGGTEAEPGLEERLRRLEEIVASLEADEVDLDRALGLFEEGVRHVRAAERILSETELRVEELLETGAEARTRPFRGEDAETGTGDEGDGGA